MDSGLAGCGRSHAAVIYHPGASWSVLGKFVESPICPRFIWIGQMATALSCGMPAGLRWRWQQRRQYLPLRVGQVTGVAQVVTVMLDPGLGSPHRRLQQLGSA